MTAFSKGDIVRITAEQSRHRGRTGTVLHVEVGDSGEGLYEVEVNTAGLPHLGFRQADLAPTEPPKMKDSHIAHQIMEEFEYAHLRPGPMQDTSKEFHDLADKMDRFLPGGPEKTVALRKLLEGKDAAVRSARRLL